MRITSDYEANYYGQRWWQQRDLKNNKLWELFWEGRVWCCLAAPVDYDHEEDDFVFIPKYWYIITHSPVA